MGRGKRERRERGKGKTKDNTKIVKFDSYSNRAMDKESLN